MAVLFYSTQDNVWEVEGSPRESFDKDTGIVECRVRLRTPWNNRHAIKTDLFTDSTALGVGRPWPYHVDQSVLNPGLGFEIHQQPPRVVTVDTENEGCVSVGGSGIEDNQYHTYDQAILDVRYSNEYAINAILETFQPTAEFIKFDYTQYKWIDDDFPLGEGEAPGKLVKGATFTITTQRMDPNDLGLEFTDRVGSCNAGTFTLSSGLWGNIVFQPEELLYAQPVTEAVISDVTGATSHYLKVTSRLVFKPGGWNKYWRPKLEDYDQFYKIGDAGKDPVINYPVADWRTNIGQLQFPWLEGNGNVAGVPPP